MRPKLSAGSRSPGKCLLRVLPVSMDQGVPVVHGTPSPRRKRLPIAESPPPSLIASEGHGGFVCQPGIYTGFQPCAAGLSSAACRPYRSFGESMDLYGGVVLAWQVVGESHLLVGTSDGIAAVWDAVKLEPKVVLCHTHVFADFTDSGPDKSPPALGVVSVAYHGGYIVTGATDGVVRLWKGMKGVPYEDILFVKAIFPPASFPPCEQIHFAIPMVSRRTDTLEGIWAATSFGQWIGYADRIAVPQCAHQASMMPYSASDVGRLLNANCVAVGTRKSIVSIGRPNREADAIELLGQIKLPGVGCTAVSCIKWRDDGQGLIAGIGRGSEFRVFELVWEEAGSTLKLAHSIAWPRVYGDRLLGVDWHGGSVLAIESSACMVFRESEDNSEGVRLVGGARERATRSCKHKRRVCLQAETPVWCLAAGLGTDGAVLCAWDNRVIRWYSSRDGGRPQATVALSGLALGMFRMDSASKGIYVVNGSEIALAPQPSGSEALAVSEASTAAPEPAG